MPAGIRVYQWTKEQDMFGFWHALYAARDNPNLLGLDWTSYATWNPQQLVGRYVSAQRNSPFKHCSIYETACDCTSQIVHRRHS